MTAVALIGGSVALVLLLPVRVLVQRRRTGRSGVVLRRAGSPAARRVAGLLALGTVATGLGPLLDALGAGTAWTPADATLVHLAGIVLLAGGIAWAFWAQMTMGDAWRVGQDESERTGLVTTGPFGRVRHPVYTGMIAIAFGVTFCDPTFVGLGGAVLVTLGAVLQALRVEEPHLREIHGAAYHDWARRTGRFLPRLR